jgi:hypothetical protein
MVELRRPLRRIYMFKMKLHPFYEMDGAIGDSPSVEGTDETVSTETASVQETPITEVSAETAESESSFARRLREHSEKEVRAARESWEKEVGEKYKDYDTHKELSSYFQQINGLDAMTLKERIEMEQLQERAEQQNVPPEVMKRLDELEAKAAKVDEFEQQQQVEQVTKTYFSTLGEFVKDKGVTPEELNQFMIENELTYNPGDMTKSFNLALKAMKADQYEKQAQEKETDTIKRYLASKNAPKVEGSTGAAAVQTVDTRKMSWDQIDKHAAERVRAMNTPQ